MKKTTTLFELYTKIDELAKDIILDIIKNDDYKLYNELLNLIEEYFLIQHNMNIKTYYLLNNSKSNSNNDLKLELHILLKNYLNSLEENNKKLENKLMDIKNLKSSSNNIQQLLTKKEYLESYLESKYGKTINKILNLNIDEAYFKNFIASFLNMMLTCFKKAEIIATDIIEAYNNGNIINDNIDFKIMTLVNRLYEDFIFSRDLYDFAKLTINTKEENWNEVAKIQLEYDSRIILFSSVASHLSKGEVVNEENNWLINHCLNSDNPHLSMLADLMIFTKENYNIKSKYKKINT